MSIPVRKSDIAYKNDIPNNARDNQYILAEFSITDDLVRRFSTIRFQENTKREKTSQENYYQFYQALANILFDLSDVFSVDNCQFIANDKIARIRFGQDMHQWQTNQQILFYYNPQSHQLQKTFFDAHKRANKITLLFLTSGNNIHENTAAFHTNVSSLVSEFANKTRLDKKTIQFRDHQHITYDLFAKHKANNQHNRFITKTRELETIGYRYALQHVILPKCHLAMTYAIVNLPISIRLLNLVKLDRRATDLYNPLYSYLTDTFIQATQQCNLHNGALIANGLVPIVRYCHHDMVSRNGELQILGYNPEQDTCGIVSKWDATELVDEIKLVFVASQQHKTEQSFVRFLNQIESTLTCMAKALNMELDKEEVMIRFHQDVAYHFNHHHNSDKAFITH